MTLLPYRSRAFAIKNIIVPVDTLYSELSMEFKLEKTAEKWGFIVIYHYYFAVQEERD